MARKKQETVNPERKEKEIKKRLKVLESSYEMYEKSKLETIKRRKEAKDKYGNKVYSEDSSEDTLELMETMQKDVLDEYVQLGGDPNNLYKAPSPSKATKKDSIDRSEMAKKLREIMEEEMKEAENKQDNAIGTEKPEEFVVDKDVKIKPLEPKKIDVENIATPDKENVTNSQGNNVNRIGNMKMNIANAEGKNIKYDVIPLPSKGKPYKHKIGKLPVAYLTAYDENMIMSPNMYNDGTFLSNILANKIMTSKVNPDDLLPGDREAILVWLRASGYGPIYPITAKDNATGQDFKTNFDLSNLSFKPFDLNADEDGYFDYEMPITKDKIKFKFLTYRDTKELLEMTMVEDREIKRNKLNTLAENINDILENDTEVSAEIKKKVENASKYLEEYAESIKEGEDNSFNHFMTNRLVKSIVSVNGVTDKDYISDYVTYLNVQDATSLRLYIANNEPGLDMNIKVEKPESLGGGSVSLFLQLDQYLFLNN